MHLFKQFLTMIEKSQISYVIYLNHVHIFKSVIFQEVLHILYFKIIPTISQKFDRNFWGPKLAHTLYSPLKKKITLYILYIRNIRLSRQNQSDNSNAEKEICWTTCVREIPKNSIRIPVSYTHLTLPTLCSV